MTAKQDCDCLDCCGDDPWVKEGKARRCKDRVRLDEKKKIEQALAAKRNQAINACISLSEGLTEDQLKDQPFTVVQAWRIGKDLCNLLRS